MHSHTRPAPAGVVIRPLQAADLDRAVDLLVLTTGEHRRFRLVERLTNGAVTGPHHAVVAERGGLVVGAAHLTAEPTFPGTVAAHVAVDAFHRGEGIGTVLAAEVEWAAARLGRGQVLTSALRDDLPDGRRFAERHGMRVTAHSLGWRYDLTGPGADGAQLAARAGASAAAAGIRVRRGDLVCEEAEIMLCLGRSMTGLPLPGEQGQHVDLAQAWRTIPRDGVVLLAEKDGLGAPVAMSIISPLRKGTDWYTVYTGVVEAHRGRGIAKALKAADLAYARAAGAAGLTTHNDVTNRAILRTNGRFGMRPSVGYWNLTRSAH
ncbi:GNAT family N-acetyltransferase [Asanoa siamensis]|uniref:N-acetyltransferase domain-containing protein n=1 Tax=Asanoa siamensis TaxID=926357 RepID=A0ABQ4CSX8_9ACTN|nr:GNAT family N-acetyltransferase [Asanoa siamensis]GIF73957.1 hypothetical protein Asi02nite_34750 [Asanoa siamensis]